MKNVPVYGISEFFQEPKDSSFYANFLPQHLEEHQFVNSHHRHSTYVCVLFTQGTGEHVIDFATYPVKRGQLFLLNPGQVHCWSLSADVDGYVFFHTQDFYDSLFLNYHINDFPFFHYGQEVPLVSLEESSIDKIVPIFREIIAENGQESAYKHLKIGSLITLAYVEISRVHQEVSPHLISTTHYEKIRKFQALIEQHYVYKKGASEYADLMNMSPRHLSRLCAETMNSTPTDLILNRVLLEAKRMLIHENSSISSVAEALGYDDYSYFIRIFKKKVGCSPKEFQNKVKADNQLKKV